jgi:hypothetical protein
VGEGRAQGAHGHHAAVQHATASAAERRALLLSLETSLDAASAARPNPGRTETLRRLNRTEYQNAIRDLLALDIDAASLLPPDESGHGFDNVTVGDLPPTLLDRYISAAQKISRLAIGSAEPSLRERRHSTAGRPHAGRSPARPAAGHARRSDHLPHLPADGEYEIQIWLARDLSGSIGGLREARAHELIVLVDRQPVAHFTIEKPAGADDTVLDRDLKARVTVSAGPHEIGVTFVKDGSSLLETARQPLQSHFNERRHPRSAPAVSQMSMTGPYGAKGADDTPSRRRLFVCSGKDESCATTILTTLMRRAYRRPIANADLERPLAFYREGRAGKDFDAGIARALSAVLINPEFLFRVESEPGTFRPAVSTESAISSSPPACRSSSGAASRTMNCSRRRRRAPFVALRSSRSRRAECLRIGARSTWPPTSQDSGCGCATWRKSIPTRVSSRISMTTCVRRSGRRPSSFSTVCCARTAACST